MVNGDDLCCSVSRLDAALKRNCQATLEEDEGFSDWTLKFGGNHQNHQGERSPGGASCGDVNLFFPTYLTSRQPEEEEENKDECEMKGEIEDVQEEERTDSKKRELDLRKQNEKVLLTRECCFLPFIPRHEQIPCTAIFDVIGSIFSQRYKKEIIETVGMCHISKEFGRVLTERCIFRVKRDRQR